MSPGPTSKGTSNTWKSLGGILLHIEFSSPRICWSKVHSVHYKEDTTSDSVQSVNILCTKYCVAGL